MYRFFDNHGKKVLAIASALLMVAFLLPSTVSNWNGHAGGQSGMLAGQALDAYEVNSANGSLRALDNLMLLDPQSGIPTSLGELLFRDLYRKLQQDRVTWYLLTYEARENGIIPDEEQLGQILNSKDLIFMDNDGTRSITRKLSEINPTVRDAYANSLRQAMAVAENFYHSQRVVKISRPMIEDFIASRVQQARARIALFDAADYAAQVAAPTDDQLRAQFDAFAAAPPGIVDPDSNPFGFGYRIPDRARLQYFVIPASEIEAAVIKSKTPELWEEDARIFYAGNKQKFAEQPATPSTAPSTQPASTQPVIPAFEAISDKVYQEMRKPLIEQKRRAIVNRVTQQMSADYQKASKNFVATTDEVAATVVNGLKLSSFEYLQRIRDDIQRQFGVTIGVVNDAEPIGRQALRQRGGIGAALLEEINPNSNGLTSAESYLFDSLEPLLPKDRNNGAIPLYLYQPTKPLNGDTETYVARVVQVDPSHPPASLEEVKDQVAKDVRRKAALAKAAEAAEAALKLAQQSALGLGVVQKPAAITTDWFGLPRSTQEGFVLPLPIPGTPQSWDSFSSQLIKPIFDLQRGLTSVGDLPRRQIIKLHRADKVAVAELFDIKTALSTTDEPMARLGSQYELMRKLMPPGAQAQWYSAEAVARRVGYVAPEAGNPSEPKKAPPGAAPNSPFVPG